MPDEAVKQLWAQFVASRSSALRAQLIECYLGLAHLAAAKFFRLRRDHAVSFSDYLQYARLGLVEAIDGFDPTEIEEITRMLEGLLVDDTPHSNPHTATELAQLREAVEKLPDRERLVIRRHYYDHREFRVIARELTITPGRVSQLHAQALGHIRLLLDLE